MKNYNDFSVEEFVQDAYFRLWALGELSPNEIFWENFLDKNPQKSKEIEGAKSLVVALKVKELDVFSEAEIKEGIHDILQDTRVSSTYLQPLRSIWIKIAASVILVFSFGWWFTGQDSWSILHFENISSLDKKVIYSNHGTKPIIFQLSDGSKITLEPQSELRYGNEFGKVNREVFLSGEAFFEVKKDVERPFLIYTGKLVTKVVGTSFRIIAYEKDSDISVSVRTGKVTVYRNDNKPKNNQSLSTEIVLVPNQKAVFEKEHQLLVKTLVDKPLQLIDVQKNIILSF